MGPDMQFLKLIALALATILFTFLSLAVVGSFASLITRTPGDFVLPGLVACLMIGTIAAGFFGAPLEALARALGGQDKCGGDMPDCSYPDGL
jgi:ABC-type transport system involved in cytochrome c biogenesis permease component